MIAEGLVGHGASSEAPTKHILFFVYFYLLYRNKILKDLERRGHDTHPATRSGSIERRMEVRNLHCYFLSGDV